MMDKVQRWQKACAKFDEIKTSSIITQLNPSSNFQQVYQLLKNYFERYSGMFIAQDQRNAWLVDAHIKAILERQKRNGDVKEYEFVQSNLDSALALIETLLANEDLESL